MTEIATSRRVAEMLLQIGAVQFRPNKPFRLASGKPSPVYVDCRRIISFPEIRSQIMEHLVALIRKISETQKFDCIAGGETAGIPFAAFVAERLQLPMAYIRKKPKGYGRNARIEGIVESGKNILLIEDLATDGGSKLRFVEAIRGMEAICQHTAVILGYGIFPNKEKELAAAGIELHRLCNLRDVWTAAKDQQRLQGEAIEVIHAFIENPRDWQSQNPFLD